jgi:phage-related tail protein
MQIPRQRDLRFRPTPNVRCRSVPAQPWSKSKAATPCMCRSHRLSLLSSRRQQRARLEQLNAQRTRTEAGRVLLSMRSWPPAARQMDRQNGCVALETTHLRSTSPARFSPADSAAVKARRKQVECTCIRTRACVIDSDDHAKKIPQRRDRSTQRTEKWRAYEPTFVYRGKCTAMVDSFRNC